MENETLSCGTGVTAAALSFGFRQAFWFSKNEVETMGGLLTVEFHQNQKGVFENIWLTGNANLFIRKFQVIVSFPQNLKDVKNINFNNPVLWILNNHLIPPHIGFSFEKIL